MKKKYNTTDLDPKATFEKHVFHRDQFAHFLRWTHILKIYKKEQHILDFGCGKGYLFEVLYRNLKAPEKYVGLDIRKKTIENNNEKWKDNKYKPQFYTQDLCDPNLKAKDAFDIIVSFEVAEHIGKENIDIFLENMKKFSHEETTFYISTPCYDPKVGAAANHIIDGQVGEFEFQELKAILEKHFDIYQCFGTFASMKDYKKIMNGSIKEFFDVLNDYYDSNLISVIMAPFFPEKSRNCLWVLKRKDNWKNKI